MKKFSNISNYTVGEKPAEVEQKIDEADLFRLKVINLLEQFLSIETYGPVDKYQRAGLIKIKGKEMAADAILSLLDEKTIKEQAKLLESLKGDIKDWEIIDNRIDELNSNSTSKNIQNYKTNHKLVKILEKYGDDEDLLIGVISQKFEKIKSEDIIKSYIISINSSKISENSKKKLEFILNEKIKQ